MSSTDDLVREDYDRAHRRAFLRSIRSQILRQPNTLLPYRALRERVKVEQEVYRGMREVPVDQIVGSVDRFQDFDRAFFPRQRHTADRWKSIDTAYHRDIRLPPVQLYKVGDIYFVKDGNHRVSVARKHGVAFIDAEVIEAQIRVPLHSSMSPAQLLHQMEYAEFLRKTNLDRTRPDHDIRPTSLGRYEDLLELIEAHRDDLTRHEGRDVSFDDAAASWFDSCYLPIVTVGREQRLLRDFPGRTEADVFLWVMANQERIESEFGAGSSRDPGQAAQAYRSMEGRRNRLGRLVRKGIQNVQDALPGS
ncbi:MAG: hypothetical protein KF883_15570 [Thermomicrobiales bacterium]|nr:hypothetical protein [Thermomicrobiales bacterium]